MSIPALGGGANQAIQRALRDAERTLADGLGHTDAEGTAASVTGGLSGTAARAARRRAAGAPAGSAARGQDAAVLLEIGERDNAEELKAVGGWITTKRSLETKGAPEPKRFDGTDVKEDVDEATSAPGRTAAGRVGQQANQPLLPEVEADGPSPAAGPAQAEEGAEAPGEPARPGTTAAPARGQQPGAGLDRMIVVLKKTGIDFRDAYQVLREINNGVKLPPKAELQARWALADPDAWEARARSEQAPRPAAGTADEAAAPARQASRTADVDLRRTAVDDVIRDRDWHKANPAGPDGAERAGGGLSVRADDDRPTLQSVVRLDPSNQTYIAGLSTAEFQRLVTVLGRTAPEWFWDLRGHRGLRGLAERPIVAKLNTTRIAGTRLGAWILAASGSGALWYVGVHTGQWW